MLLLFALVEQEQMVNLVLALPASLKPGRNVQHYQTYLSTCHSSLVAVSAQPHVPVLFRVVHVHVLAPSPFVPRVLQQLL